MFGVRISSSTKCSNWPLKAKANTHCTRSYAQFESCNTTNSGGEGGARIRVCWASTSRYTISATSPQTLVDSERIELSSLVCRTSTLPLSYEPKLGSGTGS